jgi:hypothetical protein
LCLEHGIFPYVSHYLLKLNSSYEIFESLVSEEQV